MVPSRAETAGQVELSELGMSANADALTPARFDVLAADPIRVAVRFTPAGADELRGRRNAGR